MQVVGKDGHRVELYHSQQLRLLLILPFTSGHEIENFASLLLPTVESACNESSTVTLSPPFKSQPHTQAVSPSIAAGLAPKSTPFPNLQRGCAAPSEVPLASSTNLVHGDHVSSMWHGSCLPPGFQYICREHLGVTSTLYTQDARGAMSAVHLLSFFALRVVHLPGHVGMRCVLRLLASDAQIVFCLRDLHLLTFRCVSH
jgi:hypothetical protein